MENEHEILKGICDKIWFEINEGIYLSDWYLVKQNTLWIEEVINIRILIFTPEFTEKVRIYLISKDWKIGTADRKVRDLMDNLENPVQYLDNLLK